MGRVRWRAVLTTSVASLGAITFGACGEGSPGGTAVTVTAAGRSSAAVPTITASAMSPTTPPAASPVAPPGVPSNATDDPPETTPAPRSTPDLATPTPAPQAGPRLRISHRVVPDSSGRLLRLPVFTVGPLTDDAATGRAARTLQEALEAQVAAVTADWESAAQPGSPPLGGIATEGVAVPVNEAELAVVTWRASVHTGGAHPLTLLRHVAVDVARGSTISDAKLLGQLQDAGGPAWDFERELRRAVRRQLPEAPQVATLTRDELHVYPVRAGLHVTADQCVLPCALPPLEVTIPWDRLVGPADDIASLPDDWGL